MTPPISSSKLTLTYPIFAADFLDATRLVVGGGGGEGRSGVGNKITLLDASNPTELAQLSEHLLSREEDSCMSLGIALPTDPSSTLSPVILAGVNSSEAILESGHNEHFRTIPISKTNGSLDISSSVGVTRRQLFTPIKSKEMYQRVLRTKAGKAAIANGGGIATAGSKVFEIVVASSETFKVLRRIALPSEAADLDLDEGGETLVYCTAKEIFTTSIVKKEQPRQIPTPPGEGSIRSVRFISFASKPSRLLITRNRPSRSGIDLYLLDADTGSLITKQALPITAKAATALDTTAINPSSTVAAVATASQSIHLFHVTPNKLTPSKHFTNVHPHQITKLTFSRATVQPISSGSSAYGDADEKADEEERTVIRLASTSIGNTVVVHTIPVSGGRVMSKSAGLTQTSVSLIAVVFFAVLLQYVFLTRAGFGGGILGQEVVSEVWKKAVEKVRVVGSVIADGNVLEGLRAGMRVGDHGAPFGDEGSLDGLAEEAGRLKETAEETPVGGVEDVD
ncbi:hypothetical protein EX30DRAFT_362502 [Ascodesmis nigricans]|uniref:Guanine nucleotide-exchange factor SEC12 n=1 Tax=Ascodesmis nigricans TaxID=341454 RepID=A0A4S2N1T6_9PEZI|nr:hypothetical protein EX30DRAFT_362502 [Ascodesmis nigricans]